MTKVTTVTISFCCKREEYLKLKEVVKSKPGYTISKVMRTVLGVYLRSAESVGLIDK